MTIEEVLANDEKQIFDRKSINIEPKALAVPLIAFANADGGTIAIGISDKTRRIEGTAINMTTLSEIATRIIAAMSSCRTGSKALGATFGISK